jgi:membrane protein YqaA with SNARE-associated domain
MGWLRDLGAWLMKYAATLGPWGTFFVSFSDSAFIPMPQGVDALLIAQAIAAPDVTYFAAGLAVLGSLLGSLVLYSLARRGGRMMLERRVSKRGVDHMHRQIEKWDVLVLLFPTMIPLPLPMKLFVIAAGVFQMSIARFCAVLVFARMVRYFGIAYLALQYGDKTMTILTDNAWIGFLVLLGVVVLFVGVKRWSSRQVREA